MSKREIQEINAGSMADIAFLLLIFFLMSTTLDTDMGLGRLLPPPVPQDETPPPPIQERNVFEVLINAHNQLLVKKQSMDLSQLKEAAKEFIQNPHNLESLPRVEMVDVPYFGVVPVTKLHVISLQNDRGTQYQTYLAVQNELQAAYNELRDEISKRQFNKLFRELDSDQQAAVRMIYPQRISEAEPRNYGKK